MRRVTCTLFFLVAKILLGADRLAEVRADLQKLSIDKSQTYRVRELEISRGGVKVYLSEGVLAFATPVAGHRIAAVFTTKLVDAGDAEIIAFPPVPAERASLARFTKSPNLDEHFNSALLFFADDTARDLLNQIQRRAVRLAPELAEQIGATLNDALHESAQQLDVRITQSILDKHREANSFFYGLIEGRTLGFFDFVYQLDDVDSVILGNVSSKPEGGSSYFRMWAAYRPRDLPIVKPVYHITNYRLATTIHPDLSMTSTADFDYEADADDGAVISLSLTPRMRVLSATIDGAPAHVVLHDSPLNADVRGASLFLLVNDAELPPGSHHKVHIDYQGTVIRRTTEGKYFVDDRNFWYPFMLPMLTTFDFTFRCPENLRLVSTGEPVSESIENGSRVIHRRTLHPEALAGFNLGDFTIATSSNGPYAVQICANPQGTPSTDLAQQTDRILRDYSSRWMPLPFHTLAVTPIEGYFGQGFPGLIYLSNLSYLREQDRPLNVQNSASGLFFSQLLLPHELAHQWWGNIVIPSDYRSNWIVEAMSNYAALQFLERTNGRAVSEAILDGYRTSLTTPLPDKQLVDSYGPVTFDERLLNNFGIGPWHDILYEKGTWIFHMLRQRMGDSQFEKFQLQALIDFANRPLTNEDLRQEAARFMPSKQLDSPLTAFFDTWVYGTGVPALAISGNVLEMSGVPDEFTVDVPLRCGSETMIVRATSGKTRVPQHCSLPLPTKFLFRNSVNFAERVIEK